MHNTGSFSLAQADSPEALGHYTSEGWLVVKNFFDLGNEVRKLHQDIQSLIALKCEEIGLPPTCESSFDAHRIAFMRLIEKDRSKGGDIYRACRHLVSLHQLSVAPKVIELVSALMKTSCVNYLPFTSVRIDIPREEKFLLGWHQDYPYTQGSMDGVVIWFPLHDIRLGEGNLKLLPGSHKNGLQKVRISDPSNKNKNGGMTLSIASKENWDDAPCIELPACAGDAVIFHALLLHRSTPSNAQLARWTAQLRYGNFADPDSVRRGWPGGLLEGESFAQRHPEYVEQ